MRQEIEREVPKRLFSISRKGASCVPPEKVRIAFVEVKTPKIGCDISGRATRGRISVSGRRDVFTFSLPVTTTVQANDIGGILKQETASARARIYADVRLDISSGWQPEAVVDVRYTWTDAPHIDFLGQRIGLRKEADKKLAPVMRRIETIIRQKIEGFALRSRIAPLWHRSFAVLELNRENPSVWLSIEPKALRYGGYRIERNQILLNLGVDAVTRTKVGDQPAVPKAKPLPARGTWESERNGLALKIPVMADYAMLQPVITRALEKRAEKPFNIASLPAVLAEFDNVRVYGTDGGKIAIGVDVKARLERSEEVEADGTIWITALPDAEEGTRKVSFSKFDIFGSTSRISTDLLLRIARSPSYRQAIADALAQNFEKDYKSLLDKIGTSIERRRFGDLVLDAKINEVKTGALVAGGDGIYLPVDANAEAQLVYSPQN